jgi:hypothetical protein
MNTRLLLTTSLSIAAAAVAVPALTNAAPAAQTITVHEKVTGLGFVHHAKSTKGETLAPGDSVVTSQSMKNDAGTAVGSLYTNCTDVGRKAKVFKAKLSCQTTYVFKDGEVVAAGEVTISDPAAALPIVGGSGAYTGASGVVNPGQPAKGDDSVDVLHIG